MFMSELFLVANDQLVKLKNKNQTHVVLFEGKFEDTKGADSYISL